MNCRYIFLDVDGTLFTNKGELPRSAVVALQQAKRNGHKIFLCTGRAKGEIPQILWDMHFDGAVCSAGSYIEAGGEVILDKRMPEEDINYISEYLADNNYSYLYETLGGIAGNRQSCELFQLTIDELRKRNSNIPEDFMGRMNVMEQRDISVPVYKLLYFTKEKDISKLISDLGAKYTVIKNTMPLLGGVMGGEIYMPDINKGMGISRIMEHYGKSMEDTVAFGDGPNDYEMIDMAHIGVAMGNGSEKLHKVADIVTDFVDNDGLFKGFMMAGLIEKNQIIIGG